MLGKEPMRAKINIYKSGGKWFAARWIGGEYDGCDALDVAPSATTAEAREAARTMPLRSVVEREINRVEDFE